MDLKQNADGLVEVNLLESWPPGSENAAGSVIEVDPKRAEILISRGIAEAPSAWPLKISPAKYIARHGDEPDPSPVVLERLDLARELTTEGE